MGIKKNKGGTMSLSLIQDMLRAHALKGGVTPRPEIKDQKHADAALEDAHTLLTDDFTCCAHTDEKIFYVPGLAGRFYYFKDEEPPADVAYKTCGHKRHVPKIMVAALVSQPVRSADGKSWVRNGKIGIWRCTKRTTWKKGKIIGYTERPNRKDPSKTIKVPVYGVKAGDARDADACMDAEMYKDIMTTKGLPAM